MKQNSTDHEIELNLAYGSAVAAQLPSGKLLGKRFPFALKTKFRTVWILNPSTYRGTNNDLVLRQGTHSLILQNIFAFPAKNSCRFYVLPF